MTTELLVILQRSCKGNVAIMHHHPTLGWEFVCHILAKLRHGIHLCSSHQITPFDGEKKKKEI